MELRHLQHLIAVAEHGSFTKAAASVHVVQSALSASIRSLERELGARLFERTTHQVSLTDAGAALLIEARRVMATVDAARDAVAAVGGGMRGTVRVGIMHSLALVDLASMITRFHDERPEVVLEPVAAQGGSVELIDSVLSGRLDLAFVAIPGDYPPEVTVVPLASEPLELACPPDHRLARRRRIRLSELDGESFIDFPRGWGTRQSVDRLFLREGLSRTITVEIADIVAVSELVRAGLGLAFLSRSLLGRQPVSLIPVHPHPLFAVSLVRPAGRPLSAAARAFAELALASAT